MPSRCVGFNTVLPWLSRKQKEPDERGEKNLSGKSVAPHSFPLTGKDKGRGDGFDRFLSTPITAFPHQGERMASKMQRCASVFISLPGQRKLSHTSWCKSSSWGGGFVIIDRLKNFRNRRTNERHFCLWAT